jgi:hypothetical protein
MKVVVVVSGLKCFAVTTAATGLLSIPMLSTPMKTKRQNAANRKTSRMQISNKNSLSSQLPSVNHYQISSMTLDASATHDQSMTKCLETCSTKKTPHQSFTKQPMSEPHPAVRSEIGEQAIPYNVISNTSEPALPNLANENLKVESKSLSRAIN